jgi:AraC-like DNA-binding protein
MSADLKTRLIYYNTAQSPIGHIGWAAVYNNSRWTFEGPRTIDYYSATYILDGRCHYTEPGGRDLVFVPGDLFFCFPGIPHRFDPMPGEQFSEFWCSFSGPAFDLWRDAKVLDPDKFYLHLEPTEYWLGRFESLYSRLRSDSLGPTVAVMALQNLFAEALALAGDSGAYREDRQWVAQAKSLIDAVDRVDMLDLESVARSLSMSYSSFRRRFVQLVGMPPGRYHSERLMDRACQWLYEGKITNKEIAERCGFSSEFHFSERFKQIVGMSPRDFRRRLHNNGAVDH